MTRYAKSLTIVATLLACGLPRAAVAAEMARDQGTKAAKEWLALVDAGEYGESWNTAAALFKRAVTKERWEESLASLLPPMGELVSRKLKDAEYATELPGAPDGEYVVVQFDSAFTNKATAIETVTAMRDPDGVWRVAGFFIK